MLTLYHAPQSRSSTVLQALEEMGVADHVEIRLTSIPRRDGSGGPDAENPHPDKKVPALVHDGALVTERPAILAYLAEIFPESPAICPPGHPERGPFLSWLAYYGDVVEPVIVAKFAGVDHPAFQTTFRGMDELAERLRATLAGRPWLLECGFTVADALLASPYVVLPEFTPEFPEVKDWVARCATRPSLKAVEAREAALVAG